MREIDSHENAALLISITNLLFLERWMTNCSSSQSEPGGAYEETSPCFNSAPSGSSSESGGSRVVYPLEVDGGSGTNQYLNTVPPQLISTDSPRPVQSPILPQYCQGLLDQGAGEVAQGRCV